MKKWNIELSTNAGEYTNNIIINAKHVEITDLCTLVADGIKIEFDEPIKFPK